MHFSFNYIRGIFTAGITTTSRSESSHNTIKYYIQRKSTLPINKLHGILERITKEYYLITHLRIKK